MLPADDDLDHLVAWAAREPEAEVWVKDLNSRFLAVSGALARCCGTTPADMVGRTEWAFFSRELVLQFHRDDRRAIARNQTVQVEEASPRSRYFTTKRPIRDRRGRVIGTVGVARPWESVDWRAHARAPQTADPPGWLKTVRARIQEQCLAPVSVARLAAGVHRNPNHLSRAFGRWFGMTPTEWLHRLRVEWVANAVSSSDRPLTVLALEAGFADQPHLTRIFKRYFGVTPAAYRRAIREGQAARQDTIPPF